jgi:hypothetical protein
LAPSRLINFEELTLEIHAGDEVGDINPEAKL